MRFSPSDSGLSWPLAISKLSMTASSSFTVSARVRSLRMSFSPVCATQHHASGSLFPQPAI